MKKKYIAAFAVVLLVMAACQIGLPAGSGGAKDLQVAVFYYNHADAFLTEMRTRLDGGLTALGVDYTNYYSDSSQANQQGQVEEAIEKGAGMLIVNAVELSPPDGAMAIVESARAAGIPVVFFNREVDDTVIDAYDACAFVGVPPYVSGPMQGKMIGGFLLAGDNYEDTDLNGDGAISYVMYKGMEGGLEADSRTTQSVEACDVLLVAAGRQPLRYYDENNQDKYHADLLGNWSRDVSYAHMAGILAEYNEENGDMIELVIANNDDMAWGAVAALQEYGYNLGGGKTIPVFGVDAMDFALQLISEGKMTGTVRHDIQSQAAAICMLVRNTMDGKDLMDGASAYDVDAHTAKIRIPYGIVTRN